MTMITTQLYHSPVGDLILGSFNNQLCLCNWRDKKNKAAVERRLNKHLKGSYSKSSNSLLHTTAKQLDEYFSGHRTEFKIPIILAGTEFQKQVWHTLKTIPYGQSISYLDLAKKLGQDSAVRAVANANAANALSIIIPCHRIIGSNGKLVGYAGGLQAKQGLLTLEQTQKN
jgi:methylated-DNA-[protein]-cysteine S-methyltransferase